jgi:hypothetical protein
MDFSLFPFAFTLVQKIVPSPLAGEGKDEGYPCFTLTVLPSRERKEKAEHVSSWFLFTPDYRPASGSPVKQDDDEVVLPRSSAELVLRLFAQMDPNGIRSFAGAQDDSRRVQSDGGRIQDEESLQCHSEAKPKNLYSVTHVNQ